MKYNKISLIISSGAGGIAALLVQDLENWPVKIIIACLTGLTVGILTRFLLKDNGI